MTGWGITMKKVLIVNTVEFAFGGITSVIMNYFEYLDPNKFHMDFVVNEKIEDRFEQMIREKHSDIFILKRNKNPFKYMYSLYRILKKKHYDVVHVHGNSATMAVDLLPAKLAGCPIRIAHSHTNLCRHKIFHKLLKPLFQSCYTDSIACSKEAGEWIFGKGKFEVLPNGIQIEKYRYSENIRNKKRKELSLEDKFVLGHIGFMNEQKNHEKLFSVFAAIKKKMPKAHLLCITGDPYVPEQFINLLKELQIENDVTILHQRADVNELLQAMDIFVFPSLIEGFGIALLEAQAGGLPCAVSDRVVPEVDLVKNMSYIPLELSNEKWAKEVLFLYEKRKEPKACNDELLSGIYNIKNSVIQLETIYEK